MKYKNDIQEMAAKTWAINCHQSCYDATLQINKKYGQLTKCLEHLMAADNTITTREISDGIKDIIAETEREMDYCIARITLIKELTNNDVTSEEIVSDKLKQKAA